MIKKSEALSLSESNVEFSKKLPTNLELAKLGKLELEGILAHISPNIKKYFDNKDIRRVFSGVVPEIGGNSYTFGENKNDVPTGVLDAFELACEKYAPNILVVRHTHVDANSMGSHYFSVLNLRAAHQVIENYPGAFPELAKTETKSWLVKHREEWWGNYVTSDIKGDDPDMRYGILSGFPENSARAFRVYWRAMRKLVIPQDFDADSKSFIRDYTGNQFALSNENQVRMKKLLELIGKDLTEEEKDIVVKGTRITGEIAQLGFFSVEGEKDLEYCLALDAIYRSSGIDEVGQKKENSWKRLWARLFWQS